MLRHQPTDVSDLYGRGYSDAPQVTYDTTLYTTQLALLMQHVKWDNAFIVGLSMVNLSSSVHPPLSLFDYKQGGGVATAFSAHFPHLVNGKVALIASAGIIEVICIQQGFLLSRSSHIVGRYLSHRQIHVNSPRANCVRPPTFPSKLEQLLPFFPSELDIALHASPCEYL
jgi:pimeloyl-ACP methyl ester carboxylesterase